MQKTMKSGRRYFLINIDEPYAKDIYYYLKNGQIAQDKWPEGNIPFEDWIKVTFGDKNLKTIRTVIVDLEATCWEGNSSTEQNPDDMEIIEIGAVMLDGENEIMDTFSSFVTPVKRLKSEGIRDKNSPELMKQQLSNFCKNLTGIKQSDVDNASLFISAFTRFQVWMKNTAGLPFELINFRSWGYYDKKQIMKDCDYWSIECIKDKKTNEVTHRFDPVVGPHRSIKHDFAKKQNIKPCGVKQALDVLGLGFAGDHHRALDDALNITKIYQKCFKPGE